MDYLEMLRAQQARDEARLAELLNCDPEQFTPEAEAEVVTLRSRTLERGRTIADEEERAVRLAIVEQDRAVNEPQTREQHPAVVTSEPRTYTAETSRQARSFFVDSYRSVVHGDLSARSRLDRHARECEVEGEMESRTANGMTTGDFSGLVVPQYLVELTALTARAGRPFANACRRMPLPPQGMVFNIPAGGGATVGPQATELTVVNETDQVWSDITVNVRTIAGKQEISRQSLERGTPGIDAMIYQDLANAHAVEVDAEVLNGAGTSGTLLGVLNTSGITAATAFGAVASAKNVWSKQAGAANAVETGRFLPPNLVTMHPRRWNWLLSQVDSSNRPLVSIDGNGFNSTAIYPDPSYGRIAGTFQALPVLTDANVPTTVGTEAEDVIITARMDDLIIWEDGDGMPTQLRFDQPLGDKLGVQLVVYSYVAFTAARYPKAVALVGGVDTTAGDGLVAPTF